MKQLYNWVQKKFLTKKTVTMWAAVGIALLGFQSAHAQVSTYQFSQTTGTYTPITGTALGTATGNASATNLNSVVYQVNLPFAFTFNGVSHNNMRVSTNGFITFGATAPTTTTTAPISSALTFDGVVSAFGRDLSSFFDISGVTGSVNWETVGTAPNREVVVQWTNFRPNSSTSTSAVYSFSFQIRLRETSNTIAMVYNSGAYLAGSTAVNLTAQIGLRGATNTDFKNRMNDDTVAFTSSMPGIANNSTQEFSTANAIPGMPPAGLTYTFTPATCFPPANVAVNGITTTSATVNWVSASPVPASGYDVYFASSATIPAASAVPQYTGVTGNSQVLSGLTPSSVYYVFVRSNCGNGDLSEWSLAQTFQTACAPLTSMFENFDSYGTGSIVPICWDRIITTNGSQTISSSSPASGTRNIYQYSTATQNPTVVVMPVFTNINAGTHRLRLKARATGAGNLNIGYVTNPLDAGTFNILQTLSINNTAYDTNSEYIINIPTTVPSSARLAVMNTADGLSYYWDDVYWEAIPTCIAPTALSSTGVSTNSGTVSWTPPATIPAGGYEYFYNTVNSAPTATTTPSGTVGSSASSATISGLALNTLYYVWVRSVCSASDKSTWAAGPSFTTLCTPVAAFTENFDSYSTGSIVPDCWARIITGTGTQTISATTPASGTRNLYQYSTAAQNPTVVVLPPLSNINAGTHWLRFKARVSTGTGTLNVGYVTNASDASTFTLIQALTINNTAYNNQSEYTVLVPTTVPANARLAIMNTADTVGYYYDDVAWEPTPTCFAPVNVITSNATATSATVQWTAPATAPALGYDVYYSTTNTAPTATTTPSYTNVAATSQVISPLLPSTQYYVWVRSSCSATDKTVWVQATGSLYTLCNPPTLTVSTPAAVCVNGQATFTATAAAGATVRWYDSTTATTALATGNSFTTPPLTNTTSYYVSATTGASVSTAGLPNAISTSGSTLEAGNFFNAISNVTIDGVYVYPIGTGAGTVTIALQDGSVSPAVTLQSVTVNLTGTAAPYTKTYVPLNFTVPAGTDYKLMMLSRTGLVTSLVRESGSSWGTYPITSNNIVITNGNCCSGNTTSTSYYYFYDWQVSSGCESPRQQVTATVNQGCTLSVDEIIKENNNLTVYPNPVAEVLNIKSRTKVLEVQIFSASGQRVMSSTDKNVTAMNLQSLASGVYLVTMKLENGQTVSKKIVKK